MCLAIRRWRPDNVFIDDAGIGAGVLDRLKEIQRGIIPISNSATTSTSIVVPAPLATPAPLTIPANAGTQETYAGSAPFSVPSPLTMPAKAGIHGLNAGSKALTPREFLNLRAELYGLLRKNLLNKELTLPDDQELAGQISAVRFFVTSEDQLQIESKDSVRSRGGQSPDKADALVLTLYQDLIPSQLIYF